jgi:hypothetical protein
MATPEIKVIKLKVRRGTELQRQSIVLDEGELGYVTDRKRVFIGDGSTSGGIPVSNTSSLKVANYSDLTLVNSEKGDIVRVGTPAVAYQLTGDDYTVINNWSLFTASPDNIYLKYSNNTSGSLTVVPNSLNASTLDISSLSSQTIDIDGRINVHFNESVLDSDPINGLTVAVSGINSFHINPELVDETRALVGGGGLPLSVKVDEATISYDALGALTVTDLPATAVNIDQLKDGITLDPITLDVSTVVKGVDGDSIILNNGIAEVNFNAPDNVTPLTYIQPQTLADGGTITFDVSKGTNAIVTIDGNGHVLRDPINCVPGQSGTITVVQGGVGFHFISLDNNYRVIEGDLADISFLPAGLVAKIHWETHNGTTFYLRVIPETTF